jgi:hypothetical protein
MSWDISVQRFLRGEYGHLNEIPNDENFAPLGSRKEVQQVISTFFPGTDWSDPEWGRYRSREGSIEFNMGADDPTLSFTMHVRASSAISETIVAMCLEARWQALDYSTGEFLEKAVDSGRGARQWAQYRDQIVPKPEQ